MKAAIGESRLQFRLIVGGVIVNDEYAIISH